MPVQGDWGRGPGSRKPKKKVYKPNPPRRSNPVNNLKHMQAQRAQRRPAQRSNPVNNLRNMQAQRAQGYTGYSGGGTIPAPRQRAPQPAWGYGGGGGGGGYAQPHTYTGGGGSVNNMFGGSGATGFNQQGQFGQQSFAMPEPKPIKQLNKEDWLAGDADYKEQISEYDRAMNDFKARIAKRRGEFDLDAQQSTNVTNQNRGITLDNLGEDFGARGMSYSGLFDKSKERTGDQFKRQLANIVQMKNRNHGQADEQMADYGTENRLSRSNAMRQALQRMAQQQAILNAGG